MQKHIYIETEILLQKLICPTIVFGSNFFFLPLHFGPPENVAFYNSNLNKKELILVNDLKLKVCY